MTSDQLKAKGNLYLIQFILGKHQVTQMVQCQGNWDRAAIEYQSYQGPWTVIAKEVSLLVGYLSEEHEHNDFFTITPYYKDEIYRGLIGKYPAIYACLEIELF